MATETTNLNLTKPDEDDLYDIADFNDNMDIIDDAMAQTTAQIDGVGNTLDQIVTYIGTPPNAGDTLFDQAEDPSVFYKASENFKYGYTYEEGSALAKGAIFFQFRAKYNGSIYFTYTSETSSGTALFKVYDFHPGDMVNCPLFSALSKSHYSYSTQMLMEVSRSSDDGVFTDGFVLNVTAGHVYAASTLSSQTIYSAALGYDLVGLEDIIETDIPTYVDPDEEVVAGLF